MKLTNNKININLCLLVTMQKNAGLLIFLLTFTCLFNGCSSKKSDHTANLPGARVYDITNPASWGGEPQFAATPDNPTDDDALAINAAMQAAMNYLEEQSSGQNTSGYILQQFIWLPAGTYHIATPIVVPKFGDKERYIWMDGAGEHETVVALKAASEIGTFGSEQEPLPLIQFAEYTLGQEGSGNSNFQLFATDFSITVPADQPYAVGMSYGCANMGAMRNITIRAEGEAGSTGLAVVQYNNGPAWVEDITIEGFDTGIEISDGWGEIIAFQGITLRNQNAGGTGISITDKQIAVENLIIEQDQPDVTPVHLFDDEAYNSVHGGAPHLILVHGEIRSSIASGKPAFQIDKGHTYLRSIRTHGYSEVMNDHGTLRQFENGNIMNEYVSVHGKTDEEKDNVIIDIGQAGEASLQLPVKLAPEISPDVFAALQAGNYTVVSHESVPEQELTVDTEWVVVDPAGISDHTALLQAALNSGAKYVGIVNTIPLNISRTIVINGKGSKNVKLIYGYMSEINATDIIAQRDDPQMLNDDVLFRIENGNADSLFIKGIRITTDDRTTSDFLVFNNNSTNTLVFEDIRCKDAPRAYRNSKASYESDIFFENVEFAYNGIFNDTIVLIDQQNVWARQYNLEAPIKDDLISYNGSEHSRYTTMPKLVNRGGNVWVFSEKLGEHNGVFVQTEAGGKTELLGGYFNVARTNTFEVKDTPANFIVKDKGSAFSLVGQERIRTHFDDNGFATKGQPHGNRFGVVVFNDDREMVIEATALPTYLRYEEFDPFDDTSYEIYDRENHFRVAGLINMKIID